MLKTNEAISANSISILAIMPKVMISLWCWSAESLAFFLSRMDSYQTNFFLE